MGTSINIRVTKRKKKELAAVAASHGLSLSAFLRAAAGKEARRVLARAQAGEPR